MVHQLTIALPAAVAASDRAIRKEAGEALKVGVGRISGYRVVRRSIDARSRRLGVQMALQLEVFVDEPVQARAVFDPGFQNVSNAKPVIVVGAGPAGLYAAMKLIQLGLKPVILERGKDVRSRRRDLAAINKQGVVNPESNYCYGEGGAGTYSDGKLYTRSTKRGDVTRILNLFVHFGADPDILVDAHPHIGTNKLPAIITAMREQIVACGGEVHFNTKVNRLLTQDATIAGAECEDGRNFHCDALILATGHSARDIFQMLHAQEILVESKAFALGVRIEHPQGLIDAVQYNLTPISRLSLGEGDSDKAPSGSPEGGVTARVSGVSDHHILRPDYLPPASYSLVAQAAGRGVFSFCMCPGGIIAPAATAPGELVVNGWSPSKRNNPWANSGTVVTVAEADYARYGFNGPLAGLDYQQMVEQRAFDAGGGELQAPAQRMIDFVEGRKSTTLPDCSYLPGIVSANLDDVLPEEVADALRKALPDFGRKMRGYYTNDAVLVATESRTSSPVRIPRDNETLQHPQIKGLYPCAEGAGYAGGIVSAAIDGERCAEAVLKMLASPLNISSRPMNHSSDQPMNHSHGQE